RLALAPGDRLEQGALVLEERLTGGRDQEGTPSRPGFALHGGAKQLLVGQILAHRDEDLHSFELRLARASANDGRPRPRTCRARSTWRISLSAALMATSVAERP